MTGALAFLIGLEFTQMHGLQKRPVAFPNPHDGQELLKKIKSQ